MIYNQIGFFLGHHKRGCPENKGSPCQCGLHDARTELEEIRANVLFHPRAWKLMSKKKNFIVIADDEPYFMKAYAWIRVNELSRGTWTTIDEDHYQEAKIGVSMGIKIKTE
jgi:hypothetical protein